MLPVCLGNSVCVLLKQKYVLTVNITFLASKELLT